MNKYWEDIADKFYHDFMKNYSNPMCNCRCSDIFPDKNCCPYRNDSKEIVNNFLWDDYVEN